MEMGSRAITNEKDREEEERTVRKIMMIMTRSNFRTTLNFHGNCVTINIPIVSIV